MKRILAVLAAILLASAPAGLAACSGGAPAASGDAGSAAATASYDPDWRDTDLGCGWEPTGSIGLDYARQFTIDTYDGGYRLVCMANGERFLVVPEGMDAPEGLSPDIAVIKRPVDDVYLVSTGMICLLDELDVLDRVSVSSVTADNSPNARLTQAIEDGDVVYGGRYRDPDFELIADRGCPLAIENTQINRYPEAKQKLEDLGVTVLTEQSSTEDEVLGRLEWIRLMGVLFDREDEADRAFDEICAQVDDVASREPTGKTIAFFYIGDDGCAVVRRPNDYFAQMIELAGGDPVSFEAEAADSPSSTYIEIDMEQFLAAARDADVIVYNATVDDSVKSISDLVAKNDLLSGFKAVQDGEVYSCDSTMYQQMTSTGDIIRDLRSALEGGDPETYIWRLE